MVLGGEAYFPGVIEPTGSVYGQVVKSSPTGGSSAMYTTFLLALTSAKRSIMITNPYLVLDDRMRDTLIAARTRGVRVQVLVPGAIDHNIVRQASRRRFGAMLKAGIEIYEYRAALLHAKTIVIDGVWSTVGSTNLDNRSFALNDELNVVVYGADVAGRLEQVFQEDLAHSRPVSYRDWQQRGIGAKLLELFALPVQDQF
jgi:cardiolipin synthase